MTKIFSSFAQVLLERRPGSPPTPTLTNEETKLEQEKVEEDARSGVSGTISVPETGNNGSYAHDADRRFRIATPPGTRVRIRFEVLNLIRLI